MESDCDQKRDGDEVGFLVWMHPPHGAQRFFQIQSLAMVGGNYISRGVSEDELRSWMRDYAGRNSAEVDEVVVIVKSLLICPLWVIPNDKAGDHFAQ